jgi:hypothetical protein
MTAITALRGDPIDMDSTKNQKTTSEVEAFARKSLIARSPNGKPQKPKPVKKKPTIEELMEDGKGDKGNLEYAIELIGELKDFVAQKNNIHSDVKVLITKLQKAILGAGKDSKALEAAHCTVAKNLEEAESKLKEVETRAVQVAQEPSQWSSIVAQEAVVPKSAKKSVVPRSTPKVKDLTRNEWVTVGKASKPKKIKESPKVRPKADALMIEAKDAASYAEILRKMKKDPNLKELGSRVTQIRRTRNGEMLFELEKDPKIKSSAFMESLMKVVGDDVKVKALTQEIVIECRHIDEVTTPDELREALTDQFQLGDKGQNAPIKLWKAFGGTQVGTIKLPVDLANKLLDRGKVKVGWTVCPLVIHQNVTRCYRCLGFGHQSKHCKGEDRTKRCWRCGEEGHQGKTCSKTPKCMLCKGEEGNAHNTGSLHCKAYKEATKTSRRWR